MSSIALKIPDPALGLVDLAQEDFEYFRDRIHEAAGIRLNPTKRDLVQTRLRSRLQILGLSSFSEYRSYLESLSKQDPKGRDEWQAFVNLLTTNKTDFFREPSHFEFLATHLVPECAKTTRDQILNVWCAASSTGEEPYTLAMVLKRCLPDGRDFRIFASDIDTKVLSVAQNGVYPVAKVGEIPDAYRSDITFGTEDIRNWFRIKSHLKEKITFARHNLIDGSSPKEVFGDVLFDAVFCRNVMIYFSKETIASVARKLSLSTKATGYLFIGHSESLQGIAPEWKQYEPSIYKKSRT